jgi:hypothetical protein
LHDFQDFELATEFGTIAGGRIDLLLRNENKAIIVENKIYHILSNDLDDYWDSFPLLSENKIGIVLSLYPISQTGHNNFINVTHVDFIRSVMNRLGSHILDVDQKYLIFLKDFFQNIINMSTKQLGQKELQFYFTNLPKIQAIKTLDNEVYTHIVNQIELAGQQLRGLNLLGPRANSELDKRVRYYVSPENANLVIAIIFDKVIKDQQLVIKIQLKNDLLVAREKYKSLIFSEEEKSTIRIGFYEDTNNSWSDFVIKDYVLSTENITNLADFIIDKLENEHFRSIFEKLENFIMTNKKSTLVIKKNILMHKYSVHQQPVENLFTIRVAGARGEG